MRRGLKYLGVVGLLFLTDHGAGSPMEDTDWEIIPQREGAFAYSPTSNITVAYDGVMIRIRGSPTRTRLHHSEPSDRGWR